MLQPKNRKHKKEFRGRMKGFSKGGTSLAYGDFGLQSLECHWLDGRQIEAGRITIVGQTKRKGKLWIKVFPHKPITSKSSEVKRGSGKGEVDRYVAVVKPGLILFELGGMPKDIAIKALTLAAHKLPMKTRIIEK